MPAAVEPCPRCGGKCENYVDPVQVKCLACKATWASETAFDRECIARDLAGNRAAQVTAGYLEDDPEACKILLSEELKELVALVEMRTYENVMKNIDLAVKGREKQQETAKAGSDPITYDQLAQQIFALNKMRDWAFSQMMGYGVNGADSS